MKKKICMIIIIGMALTVGTFLFGKVQPLGISSAYATPDRGKNCAQCHTSRGSSKGFTNSFMMETCDGFSSTGSNPYFMQLQPGAQLVLEGKESGQTAHLTITVLDETRTFSGLDIGGGVTADVVTAVVEENQTMDGVLAEISRNYFAICNRTNSVFYFGEDVDIYDPTGTTVVSHDGAWLAGSDGARAGIMMPGTILLGGKYFQEVAPGVAMDRAEIISMSKVLETPAGTFENCVRTRETTPMEPGVVEFKIHAPGIGLIKDGKLVLTDYTIIP